MEAIRGEPLTEQTTTVSYTHADGTAYVMPVRVASTEPDAALFRPLSSTSPAIAAPPSPIRVPAGRTRLSASQLMQFTQNPKRWWLRYAFGF